MILEKINESAKMWEKTKNPKYKDLWYKLVKEFANGKNINNINSSVRRDTSKRRVPVIKTDGSA